MTDWTPVPQMNYPEFKGRKPSIIKAYSPIKTKRKKKSTYSKTKAAANYRLDMLSAQEIRNNIKEE